MKTRRMARYERLRRVGFMRFEARPLSRVSPNVPYFRDFMKRRAELYGKALKMGTTETAFENQIKELYQTNGWVRTDRLGRKMGDPWKMFRNFEDKHKAKNPQYTSPWMKRQKNMRDFMATLERTLQGERIKGKQ